MRVWRLMILLVPLGLAGCASSPEPDRARVVEVVGGMLRPPLELEDLTYKNFTGRESGTGRTSISGTLVVSENTYIPVRNGVADELRRAGFTDLEIVEYGSQLGYWQGPTFSGRLGLVLYRAHRLAGEKVQFSAELQYLATADGFRFAGNLNHAPVDGEAFGVLPGNAMIEGSAQLASVISSFAEAKSAIEEVFRNTIVHDGFIEYRDYGLFVQNRPGQGNLAVAIEQCDRSTVGGYDDWRLPTPVEIQMFGDSEGHLIDAPDGRLFGALSKSNGFTFWTSEAGMQAGQQVSWGYAKGHDGYGETPAQGWAIGIVCVRRPG